MFSVSRMSTVDFELLLKLIAPKIQRQNTKLRDALPVQDRLAVTLKYLATGDCFSSLASDFDMSKQAIGKIVPEVCKAIVEKLRNYVKVKSIYLIIKITSRFGFFDYSLSDVELVPFSFLYL